MGVINLKHQVDSIMGAKIAVVSAMIALAVLYFSPTTDAYTPRATSSEPINLIAESIDGQIHLDWDAPTVDTASVTGYKILRGKMQTTSRLIALFNIVETGAEETAYLDVDIVPDTEYIYCVQALRSGVQSAPSNCLDAGAIIQTGDGSSSPISVKPSLSCVIQSVVKDRILVENLIGEGYETYDEAHDTYPSVSFTMNPDCPVPVLTPAPSSERSIGPGFNRSKKSSAPTVLPQRSELNPAQKPDPDASLEPGPTVEPSSSPTLTATTTPKRDSTASPKTSNTSSTCYEDPAVLYKWISCPREYWAPGHYPW